MSPVVLTFGTLKRAEARTHQAGTVITSRNHGIRSIQRNNKNISSRELVGIQSLRDIRYANEKATSITPAKKDQSKASDIANKAAIEAKAASDAQNMAGRQAAHQVKVQLANKAAQSAKAAEAALSGKIALIEQLDDETRETQTVLKEGMQELERVRENTDAALKVVNYARQQLQILMRAVETAKSSLESAQLSSQGAKTTLDNKEQLLTAANQRVVELKRRLDLANEELAKTKEAASKAEEAARDARAKVSHVDLPLFGLPV